ncbi:o-succinylbenzoate synthase [Gordonia araii NBRC 100433]|uniref:o-succinylbenzoate synthase n=1 Tax=Gordonia araii NBRC 100433 TaxID=1073574 RepID=G7GZA9_9ACTN|nr:o-succinylbenzoate synthase [Gordonia araii]NNG98646.1 o-succinylbenzoate synthase [Gordonia araii NBRC 100433]GAB08934.1 o-succinylbenzoate synthase [Gordonia araii NBRC 100433]
MLPPLDDLLDTAIVVALPMRMRFRGIATREALLFRGPAGWGEFSPFVEYGDEEASTWLAAGIEAAWLGSPPAVRDAVEVNATVPAVPASQVAEVLARFPGARTAKVKVAEKGQTLRDDIERVAAVRDLVAKVRVDANGGWTADEAVAAIGELGELEYVEQPCATVEELAGVRRRVDTPIAADESIRKADDPLRVVAADAADIAVVKVAPLGGMRRVLELAEQIPLPIVVSSALDTAVGISAGVATAAALPRLSHACGLGTGALFVDDVTRDPPRPHHSELRPGTVVVADPPLADPARSQWWRDRLTRCHRILARR